MARLVYCQRAPLTKRSLRTIARAILTLAGAFIPFASVSGQDVLTPRLMEVARYNAPLIIAETREICLWGLPCASKVGDERTWPLVNHLLPVDFDGDHLGNNNLRNLNWDLVFDARPVTYFSIAETGTGDGDGYFYIGYYFYHGRDGGAYFWGGYWDEGHEHDMEGIFLIVRKNPWAPYGLPILALTEAHGALIPFGVDWRVDFDNLLVHGGVGSWGGKFEFWHDNDFGIDRPVVAIRAGTHGTYMAQNCNPSAASYYFDGYGMWAPRSNSDPYLACIHGGHNWIMYMPAVNEDAVAPMGNSVVTGTYEYQLRHLADSPLWAERLNPHVLLGGTNLLYMGFGLYAQDIFEPLDYYGKLANPPWAWLGGPGSASYFWGNGGYWYNFAEDGTSNAHFSPGEWDQIPVGSLLVDGGMAARKLFRDTFSDPDLFNAYRQHYAPPSQSFSAGIEGPDVVNADYSSTWTASISNGTAPFTYSWSGVLSGSGSSVSGALYESGDLYLDVWDATGAHVAISKWIEMTGCSGREIC